MLDARTARVLSTTVLTRAQVVGAISSLVIGEQTGRLFVTSYRLLPRATVVATNPANGLVRSILSVQGIPWVSPADATSGRVFVSVSSAPPGQSSLHVLDATSGRVHATGHPGRAL